MAEIRRLKDQATPTGDSIIMGILGGTISGIVMIGYLVAIGLVDGETPAMMFSRFDIRGGMNPLVGVLTHLSVSGVYGLLYTLGVQYILRRRVERPLVWFKGLLGLFYGGLLLYLAWFVILPGTGAPLEQVKFAHLAIAHAIYGFVLGLATNRLEV